MASATHATFKNTSHPHFLQQKRNLSIKITSRTCRLETCRYLKLPNFKLRLISWEWVTNVMACQTLSQSVTVGSNILVNVQESLWTKSVSARNVSLHVDTSKTHTRTHARMQARTHTHARRHASRHTHARTHAHTHARTHTRTHSRTHTHTHAHAHEGYIEMSLCAA